MDQLQLLDGKDSLDSIAEVETALQILKEIDDKTEWYKKLKAERTRSCEQNIKLLNEQHDRLRDMIGKTLTTLQPKQKTFDFPDVAKVTCRELKESLKITEPEKVIEFLDKKMPDAKAKLVKTVEVLDTAEAKKFIETIKDQYNIPGVTIVPGQKSLSISFSEDVQPISLPVEEKKKLAAPVTSGLEL